MKKLFTALCALTVLPAAVNAQNEAVWDSYETIAQGLMPQFKTMPKKDIAKHAKSLVTISKDYILPEFAKKHPVCKEYVDAIIAATDDMLTSSIDEIEKHYHADGKLPPMKQAVCYHAKDLLVHPATVYVLAKTAPDTPETREQMFYEMDEVLEHFEQAKGGE